MTPRTRKENEKTREENIWEEDIDSIGSEEYTGLIDVKILRRKSVKQCSHLFCSFGENLRGLSIISVEAHHAALPYGRTQ